MKQLILVDSIQIGLFAFNALIFSHKNDEIGFGIFIENVNSPLIMFENFKEKYVKISVNEELIKFIAEKSISDLNERQHSYILFMDFVRSAESIAAEKVFKNIRMEYLSDNESLLALRKIYLNGNHH